MDFKRKIELAKEKNGLYYLEIPSTSEKIMNKLFVSLLSPLNKDIV